MILMKSLKTECVACPEGFQNQYGNTTLKDGPDGECTARTCNDNEYSDGTVCLPCPQYTGAVSAGLDPTQGATQCTDHCQTDEHVVNNVCTPCDANSYKQETKSLEETPTAFAETTKR